MTVEMGPIDAASYSHDLLLHANDDELIEGTRAFVEQGLESGGQVIVHSTAEQVALLRDALGSHPRLEYGLDCELYQSPSTTLFAYERKLAESTEPVQLWATGTVPMGADPAGHPAWSRYESLVNEVLGSYAFHGLCSYDTQALPASTIAAAKATHPCISTGLHRAASAEYQHPAAFLTDPLAAVPPPPDRRPTVAATLDDLLDLRRARDLMRQQAIGSSALPHETVAGFVTALNEVLTNGLVHGGVPVRLSAWVEPARLTCLVSDSGTGISDSLAGYRYPGPDGPQGLWVARQLCEDLFVRNLPGGGCQVMMATG